MSDEERTAEEWGRVGTNLPGAAWFLGMRVICTEDPGFGDYAVGRSYRINDVKGPLCAGYGDVGESGSRDFVLPGVELGPHFQTRGVFDPDDPSTAGCLLALLGDGWSMACPSIDRRDWSLHNRDRDVWAYGSTLGRACIAAAEALGRWPGGAA